MSLNNEQYKRVCWASRRGMLELDLIMLPFAKERFPSLTDDDQRYFITLLENEDSDLFAWLLGHTVPNDPKLAHIVGQIRDYAYGH